MDIGANVGNTTRELLTMVGGTGHVIAVEPNAEAVSELRTMKEQFLNLTIYHGALKRRTGLCKLYRDLYKNDSRYAHTVRVDESSRDYDIVECSTFKDLVHSFGVKKIDFVTLDVRGNELEVLMCDYLVQNVPKMIVFFWSHGVARNTEDELHGIDLLKRLSSNGFKLSVLDRETGEPKKITDIYAFDSFYSLDYNKDKSCFIYAEK